jgi:hypothetical protein
MNFDPKAIRRALMVAKDLATKIDPGFAVHNLPMPPQGVPLERAKGGPIKTIEGADRERNLAAFMQDAHPSVLNENNTPKVFYHGTSADFKKFKLSKTGSYGKGVYLTPCPEDAAEYTDPRQGSVYPVHVSIKNPYKVDFTDNWQNLYNDVTGKFARNTDDEYPSYYQSKEIFDNLKRLGFDGIEVQNAIWHEPHFGESHFIAFDPTQIKSAVGNVGAFDSSSPDITKAEGGEVETAGMGINVRSDKKAGIRYADEIVDGNKKYETRDSDSLRPYVGKRVAIVRTGEGPAKAIGEVTVGEPIVADQAMFHKMRPHHLVPAGSAFDIKPGSQKYLYPMHDPARFDTEKDVGAGIIARKVMSKAEGGTVDDHPDQGYAPKPAGVLDVDNPGGDWLKENREYSESRGYMPSGAPKSFGKVTAVWRKPKSNEIAPVYLPVSMLAQLPGVMSEQGNVRSNDLDWLVDHMGKTGKLPKVDDREYKPFITVDHHGRPFVSEGNHRIMAAAKLGWDYLPVEVRYFNGAEGVDGPLHPDRIKAMHPPKKQIGGAVEDDDMPARKLNNMGMYSAAAEAARNLPQERGSLQQMLASLKGVKPDEINFSDVQNRLGDKPIVTKQELADYFSRNIPKLEVTSFDEDSSEAAKNRYTDFALTMGGKESNYAEDLIQYREPFSLSMSKKPAALKAGKNAFYTEHYPEIPNILAHVRRSDREGPNGEKLLHLEELQSDWGQTGKKHGFENPVVPGTVIEDPDYPGTFRINWQNGRFSAGYRSREIAEGMAVEGAAARAKYTPLVPHVGTTGKWMDLALKRALNMAAKGNYDGIIWTPGDKQVERYKSSGESGEGLKYLYDNIVPKQLLGLAKEHDPSAKVESLSAAHDPVVDGFPMIRISPKMRESIKKRGFKAFSTGGFAMPQPVDSDKTIRRALMIAKKDGGKTSDIPKALPEESNIQDTNNPKRILINAEGKGGVRGIVVPRHMWEGGKKVTGMREINKARADVYGSENRDPLTIGQIGKIHKDTLDQHFDKPVDQQIAAENEALKRLQQAKHIAKDANTLDTSEKLDTVRHETDDQGRTYEAYGAKGVAGHAIYTSGFGPNQKQIVLNTCPGQTVGCGGGVSPQGIVDTMKGTCFAPTSESRLPAAAVRRACHAQAKHDPAMTRDWILAHVGSLRKAANIADKNNQVVLFRPNVVDESDTSSRYVISNLNKQREELGKPGIVANSYGKTNELHDPENGYFVTYSNAGPKTKLGYSVSENTSRDKQRVRATISATDAAGRDFQNEQGNNTPPKNSYMVTDVKRGSDLNKAMEKAFKYAKYWSTGRMPNELSPEEQAEGTEGHFDGSGNPTTPDKAHYGHTTRNGLRYDYQKQHILHPRLVQVGMNDDGTPHMIPTDSRFKDNEYLPKNRFMTKNGKEAGAILMTTPTTSTSNLGHQTSFTHHVDDSHIDYANQNNGEYQIDPPEEQEASIGKEYVPPQEIKFRADGGAVHAESDNDDLAAFPEQSYVAQRHNAHKSEEHPPEHHHAYRPMPVGAANVDRALQLVNRLGIVPGMIPPYGRR